MLAARSGTIVRGVDTAERLIEVANERAAAEGLPASFTVADAQALPFADAMFDVVVSVMGVVYAPDARRALGEALRVTRPGGRVFIAAWLPGGGLDAMVGARIARVSDVIGPGPDRFRWGTANDVRALAGTLGATADFQHGAVLFTAESPEAFLVQEEREHPASIWSRGVLEGHGADAAPLHDHALAALREYNEDPTAFRSTSHYHVAELRHA